MQPRKDCVVLLSILNVYSGLNFYINPLLYPTVLCFVCVSSGYVF